MAERGGFGFHHVLIEVGRPAHCLTGVVDDEIEAIAGSEQMVAKGFNAGRVPQVEPKDLEPLGPFGKVRLPGVARRRIAGKAGRDDKLGSRAEQLDSSLVANLDPSSRQQRHPARQVR